MKELSCILLQLEFDNYERNCQPEVLSQIADKDLVSSEFWSRFSKKLLIDLIESFLSNSSPLNKEIFFQSRQKNKRVWSLHRWGFSTQFKSNSDLSEKHSENTCV